MTVDSANFLASIGVSILLFAFFLQLAKILSSDDRSYLLLNFIGGAVAALSSFYLNVMAFVVLEGTWSLMAGWLFFRSFFSKKSPLCNSEI